MQQGKVKWFESDGLLRPNPQVRRQPAPRLKLLLELEPAHRVFFRNLADTLSFRPVPPIVTTSRPGPFWSDVFVPTGFPRWGLMESLLWHTLAIAAVCLFQYWGPQARPNLRDFHRSYVSYYTPSKSFPAIGSYRPPVHARSKRKRDSEHDSKIKVTPERSRGLITPPDIKLAQSGRPNIVASNQVLPGVPFSATGRSRLTAPAGSTAVIVPPPEITQATSRQAGLPQASVVAPPPNVGAVSGGRAMAVPNAAVVAPPPVVQVPMRQVGDVNIGRSAVVGPSPRLPIHEQQSISGVAQGILGGTAASVVPPPPSVQRSGTLGNGRASPVSGAGLHVVPPPPSVDAARTSTGGGRMSSFSGAGLQVVPPPPSVDGSRSAAGAGRMASLPGSGLQVVPPPPSVEGAGSSPGGGRQSSLSTAGAQVVPPPPSVDGTGTSAGGGRLGSLSSAGLQGAPLPPSVVGAGYAAGGERLLAMDAHPTVAPPRPPPPVIDSPSGSTEELPLRLIGLALALPSSSYFSNYEVYIAERRLSKDQTQLIKLVYVSLPYQRRLSEYVQNNARVYKLRVTRDPTCDETLLQMTWPEGDEPQSDSQRANAPPDDRSGRLPCYRTTADDYRKALSQAR